MNILIKIFLLKSFFFLFLPFAYAAPAEFFLPCKIGANSYSKYALKLDAEFQELSELNYKKPELYQEFLNKIKRRHEDFKDQQYKTIENFYRNEIEKGKVSVTQARIEQPIVESTIDFAYIVVGNNFMNGSLTRSFDHYVRRITEECMSNK
jgi:hypothetical protein